MEELDHSLASDYFFSNSRAIKAFMSRSRAMKEVVILTYTLNSSYMKFLSLMAVPS